MKRLIVNADDFGMAEPVDLGIVKAHREGIVRSASFLACGESARHAADLAGQNPELDVGVHLCLTRLEPVSDPSGLRTITRGGRFLDGPLPFMARLFFGAIDQREILVELRAQVERALELGIRPTHLDGHQHLHVMPGVFHIVAEIAKEFDITSVRFPVGPWTGRFSAASALEKWFLEALVGTQRRYLRRMGLKHPDRFLGLSMTGRLDADALKTLIASLPDGVSEIMCHPGLPDEVAAKRLGFGSGWERELSAVTDPGVRELVDEMGIELISYKSL